MSGAGVCLFVWLVGIWKDEISLTGLRRLDGWNSSCLV